MMDQRKCGRPDNLGQNRIPDKFIPGKFFHQKISYAQQTSKMWFLENRILAKKTGSGCPGDIGDMSNHYKKSLLAQLNDRLNEMSKNDQSGTKPETGQNLVLLSFDYLFLNAGFLQQSCILQDCSNNPGVIKKPTPPTPQTPKTNSIFMTIARLKSCKFLSWWSLFLNHATTEQCDFQRLKYSETKTCTLSVQAQNINLKLKIYYSHFFLPFLFHGLYLKCLCHFGWLCSNFCQNDSNGTHCV